MGPVDAELRRRGVALEFWTSDAPSPSLAVGSVLRARDAERGDPYALAVVIGTHAVDGVEEAVIAPYVGFGSAVSAPVFGEGGILRAFEVMTEAEVAEVRASVPAASGVDPVAELEAAKADLLAAREGLA